MRLALRPIDVWPGELTTNRRISNFSATYTDTIDRLEREIRALHTRPPDIVVQAAVTEDQLRRDGGLRASAQPSHPGVIVSFESKHGPLRYHADTFTSGYGRTGWHDNLRAIALGLEALRKIDRYGITTGGQQFTGWQAIGPAAGLSTKEEAARLIARVAWPNEPDDARERWFRRLIFEPEMLTSNYRAAVQRAHPDAGGDPDVFRQVMVARDLLAGTDA